MLPTLNSPSFRRDQPVYYALGLSVFFVFIFHLILAYRFSPFLWVRGHDLKHYGGLALNFLNGLGFRVDSYHISQLSYTVQNVDCFVFQFLHPWIVAQLMRVTGDTSFFPVFLSTPLYLSTAFVALFFLLRRWMSAWGAWFSSLIILFSPHVINPHLLGLTEGLMILLLVATFLMLLRVRNERWSSFGAGLTLGLLNTARATGIILFPAFTWLVFRQRGPKNTCLFILGFSLPTAVGQWLASQGQVAFGRFSNLAWETDHFGGPSQTEFHDHFLTFFEILHRSGPFILKKVAAYTQEYFLHLNRFWGEEWIFLPVALFAFFRSRKGWTGFWVLVFAASYASVCFYWLEPRVNLHLKVITLTLAIFYLYALRQKINFSSLWLAVRFFALFWMFHHYLSAKLFYSAVLALFSFAMWLSFRKRSTSDLFRRVSVSLPLGVFLALQTMHLKTNAINLSEKVPAQSYPYQTSMEKLAKLNFPKDAFVITNQGRDVTWYLKRRALYMPDNLRETATYLRTLKLPLFVLLTEKPDRSLERKIHEAGFVLEGEMPSLWIYRDAEEATQILSKAW